MDLGISGRVALVLGASKGLGPRGRDRAQRRGRPGRRRGANARCARRRRRRHRSDAVRARQRRPRPRSEPRSKTWRHALGPIEILITNTGGPPARPDALAHPREEWELAHRTLVLAPLALIEAVVPGMRERGFGRIVNIASWAIREPAPEPDALQQPSLRDARGVQDARAPARLLGDHGQQRAAGPDRDRPDLRAERGPRGSGGDRSRARSRSAGSGAPEEIAAAVAFLCSERASLHHRRRPAGRRRPLEARVTLRYPQGESNPRYGRERPAC